MFKNILVVAIFMLTYCGNNLFACEWTSHKPVVIVQPQPVFVQEVRPVVVYYPVVVYPVVPQPQPVVIYSQPVVAPCPVYVSNPWVRYRY